MTPASKERIMREPKDVPKRSSFEVKVKAKEHENKKKINSTESKITIEVKKIPLYSPRYYFYTNEIVVAPLIWMRSFWPLHP